MGGARARVLRPRTSSRTVDPRTSSYDEPSFRKPSFALFCGKLAQHHHLIDLRRHRNTTPRVARESQRKPARPSSGRAARARVRFSPHTSELARGHDRGSQLRWQKQRTICVNPRPSGRTVCAHEPVTIVRCCYGCRPKWTASDVRKLSPHQTRRSSAVGRCMSAWGSSATSVCSKMACEPRPRSTVREPAARPSR